METTSLRTRRIARVLLAGTALYAIASPARAQDITLSAPPLHETVDGNGVNLATGEMNLTKASISIGQGSSAMSYAATIQNGLTYDNLEGWIAKSGSTYTVNIGGTVEAFTLSGGVFTANEPRGATLATSSSGYVYTMSDGTVATFENAGDPSFSKLSNDPSSGIPMLASIVRPNGERIDFTFYSQVFQVGMQGCCTPILATGRRVTSASSNFGYQIRFDYATNSVSGYSGVAAWSTPTKVRAINTAVEACLSSASPCTTTKAWPTLDIAWDPNGRVQTFTDSASRQTRLSYNGGTTGKISGVRFPGSSSDDVTITYGTADRVSSVTAGGVTTSYAYSDSNGIRTTSVTRPGPSNTSLTRSMTFEITTGLLKSATNEVSKTTNYSYDSANRLQQVTLPQGNYLHLDYDARGNLKEKKWVASGLPDIVESAAYSTTCSNIVKCNKPNSTTDARGNTTTYEYDDTHGGLTKVTLPAVGGVSPETRISYDNYQSSYYNGSGTLVTPTITLPKSTSACQTASACSGQADEVVTEQTYSSTTNLLPVSQTTRAGDNSVVATTGFGYDDVRNTVSEDGPLTGSDDTTYYRFDSLRRRVGTISADPDGSGSSNPLKRRAQRLSYSDRGLLNKVENGTVDGTDDSSWAAFANLQTAETGFDVYGRAVWSRTSAGGTVYSLSETSYDVAGRPICTVQRVNPADMAAPTGNACGQGLYGGAFGYDQVAVTTYDDADRVVLRSSAYLGPNTGINDAAYTYTDNGLVQTATDGEGNVTTYVYDAHDRLSQTRYPNAVKTTPRTSNSSDYEQLTYETTASGTRTSGTVAAFRNRAGESIGFGYDALGRRNSKDLPGTEPDVTYSYDLLGRLTGASQTGSSVSFSYDALGRQLTETGALGTMTSQWDAAGRRTSLTWPGSTWYVGYDYYLTGEVKAIRENGAVSGAGVLATFGYDDLGRRTSLTRGNGVVTAYGYTGPLLTSLGNDLAGSGQDMTITMEYNKAMQLVKRTLGNDAYAWTGHASGTSLYDVNGLNQMTSINTLWYGATTESFDSKGNLAGHNHWGVRTFSWSSENLLKGTTQASPASNWTFGWDPLMRMSASSAFGGSQYLYDGDRLVGDRYGTGPLTRYVHGPGTDEPLVAINSSTGARTWYVADERGSIVATTDGTGAAAAIQAYDENGITTTQYARFGYTGQMILPELGAGTYYYKARIYDARRGGFLSADPIGYGGGMNLYAYAGGDPVNGSDPTGLRTQPSFKLVKWNGTDVGQNGAGVIRVVGQRGLADAVRAAAAVFYGNSGGVANPPGNERNGGGGDEGVVDPVGITVTAPGTVPNPPPTPMMIPPAPPFGLTHNQCEAAVDILASTFLITGGSKKLNLGTGVLSEFMESKEVLNTIKILKGIKATTLATGIGAVAVLGGSLIYFRFRDKIIKRICG